MDDVLRMTWAGEEIVLTPERALAWPGGGRVFIADTHFGKAEAFRRWGVPVPSGTTGGTLRRLDALLDRWRPGRLVIVGDLLHSKAGCTAGLMETLTRWRERHATVEITVVRGNHDVRAGDPPETLRMTCVDEPAPAGPFRAAHDAENVDPDGAPFLCGHVHPVVVLRDRDGSRLRAPCFVVGPSRGILPAFGLFTGGKRVRAAAGDRVFAVGPADVVEVPTRMAPA